MRNGEKPELNRVQPARHRVRIIRIMQWLISGHYQHVMPTDQESRSKQLRI